MDADAEVQRILNHGSEEERRNEKEEEKNWMRPPSSYGSMKSDSDEREEEEEEEEEDEEDGAACASLPTFTHFVTPAAVDIGVQLIRSESPETLYTMTTLQTKPPGAMVIDTRSSDLDRFTEDEEEDEEEDDDILVADSPEPPETVEPDEVTQTEADNSQPGRLHPQQDMPHIFKSILDTLKELTEEELLKFKFGFRQWQSVAIPQGQLLEGDVLDFVDKIFEVLGKDRALLDVLHTLRHVNKADEAEELQKRCERALARFHLKEQLIRKYEIIREGVPQPGRQNRLDTVYVHPQISLCSFGGVDPSHEVRPHPPSPLQVPSVDNFVELNNLFRLTKENGQPVRTVVTTGIPGIGLSVSVGKFCLDWAQLRANMNLQFILKLSFRHLWNLRSKTNSPSKMSMVELIEYKHRACKDMKYLGEADCKFLIIMDSFDSWQSTLDWKNAPVITDSYTQALPDDLIINLIRGNLLPGGFVWILGRRAAISQIPAEFIDVVTEIQGFSDEMKDDYLTRRFRDADLASAIVAHYRRLPTLRMLCGQPFVCWMVATLFQRRYRYVGYGVNPPKLTPMYVNILIVQTNRNLEFYHHQSVNDLKWSTEDKQVVMKIGKMALKMLDKNTSVFFEEDVMEHGLNLMEVTVCSGLCTELPAGPSTARRRFCFVHLTYQEFMAALYVFAMFHMESKNVLDAGLMHKPKLFPLMAKSAAGLVQAALDRTLKAPLGQYDMFLRFLCGLLWPGCHKALLGGNLFPHKTPEVGKQEEVKLLLEKSIESAQQERLANLKECLRELTQVDE